MNRDQLPIAWVAHANGQLLGTAALRVHDLEGREDLTPWLGGVFVGSQFRRQGIGAALCATVEDAARSRGIQTLYLFTLDKQAWYSRQGWTAFAPCVWHERPGDIMSKDCRPPNESMKRLFRLDVLLIVVVPLVDSLAVAVGAETGNFAGLVDIGGGRKMY